VNRSCRLPTLCAHPGCAKPAVLCEEHRGGGEREATCPARERTDAGGGSRPRDLRRSGPRHELLEQAARDALEYLDQSFDVAPDSEDGVRVIWRLKYALGDVDLASADDPRWLR
jgi:hypothetical protein